MSNPRHHCSACNLVTPELRTADAVADAVEGMIQRREIDARSPAADALLDYRESDHRDPTDTCAGCGIDPNTENLGGIREGADVYICSTCGRIGLSFETDDSRALLWLGRLEGGKISPRPVLAPRAQGGRRR